MAGQEMIDVWIKGTLVTTVPKSSEPFVRKHYSGKPEERVLAITPHGYQSDPKKQDFVQKLNPKQ